MHTVFSVFFAEAGIAAVVFPEYVPMPGVARDPSDL
jgi:hypothetical protein